MTEERKDESNEKTRGCLALDVALLNVPANAPMHVGGAPSYACAHTHTLLAYRSPGNMLQCDV